VAIGRTTSALIASIRRRTFIKSEDPDFTDADITAMLNEQVGSYLSDLIRPYCQNYALQQYDTLLVDGQSDYAVPTRALNGTVEAMGIIDPTGVVPGYRLIPYDPQDAILLQQTNSGGIPVAYDMPSNVIRLYPTPSNPTPPMTTLRLQYFQRPSELVDVTAVATLNAALSNITATTYRVNISGTAPSTFTVGAEVEIVAAAPGYSTYAPTAVISGSGSGYVDVTGVAPVAPYTPVSGDYLCLVDQAPVITNIPLEFQECLLQWVGIKMLEAKGDQAGMDRMGKVLAGSEAALRHQLPKRNMGARRFLSAWAGMRGVPVRGLLWPLLGP